MKTFWNVMGCIGASLFSVILVVILIVFPLYSSAASFAQPKKIAQVVQSVDYTEFLPDEEEWKELIPNVEGISTESITNFLEHDVVGDVIELYAEDFLNATLNGEITERALNAEALKELVNENMDQLVEFVEPYIAEDSEVTVEQIKEHIREAVDTHADTIVEALPLPEPVPEGEEDPFALIRQFLDPMITVVLCVTLVLSAAIVYACRFKRFQGLLWLGIDSLVATLLVGTMAGILGSSLLTALIDDAASTISTIITPIIEVFTHDLTITAVITGVVGVALIVTYILLRRRMSASPTNQPVQTEH